MKISEMTNKQATEAIIRLADPIGNLCDDEEIAGLFKELGGMGEVPMITTIGKLLPRFIAYGFQKHIDDLYEIVGALTMQNRAQVEKMNFAETLKTVKDSYDDILASFFPSSNSAGQKDAEK